MTTRTKPTTHRKPSPNNSERTNKPTAKPNNKQQPGNRPTGQTQQATDRPNRPTDRTHRPTDRTHRPTDRTTEPTNQDQPTNLPQVSGSLSPGRSFVSSPRLREAAREAPSLAVRHQTEPTNQQPNQGGKQAQQASKPQHHLQTDHQSQPGSPDTHRKTTDHRPTERAPIKPQHGLEPRAAARATANDSALLQT